MRGVHGLSQPCGVASPLQGQPYENKSKLQTRTTRTVGEDAEHRAWPLWKPVWPFLKVRPIPFRAIYLSVMKDVHTKACTQMFIAASFIIDKGCKPHKCPLTDKWTHLTNGIFGHRSEFSAGICDSVDEPWKRFPKWKGFVTEDHIVHDSTHRKLPEGELCRARKEISDC